MNAATQITSATGKAKPPLDDGKRRRVGLQEGAGLARLQLNVWSRGALAVHRLGAVGVSGVAMLVLAVILATTAVAPAERAIADLRAQLSVAAAASVQSTAQIAAPGTGASEFARLLPSREQLPAILALIAGQAEASNLHLQQGSYEMVSAKASHISRYQLQFPVKGSYLAIRQFVDGTLAAVPAAALESIRMERKDVSSEELDAELNFVVFVRGER